MLKNRLGIGRRCYSKCGIMLLDGQEVHMAEEFKYLGIYILKGLTFVRSFVYTKIKFYRCFNAIYSKASYANEVIMVNLFKSYCVPIVTYACETTRMSNTVISSLNKLIDVAFCKMFNTYDKDIIAMVRQQFDLADIGIICVRDVWPWWPDLP